MSDPTRSRSLASDIETVTKFIELIEAKSFKADEIWIHQRRVKAICDGWKYPYAFDLEFDPFPSVHNAATSEDLTKVCQAWEVPRIKAVQLRDYLEEMQSNS